MASILQVKINNSWVAIPALQGNKGPSPEYAIDYWTRSDKDDIIARILGARQLAAPTIQLEDSLLIIEPVENATTYDIYINGEYITSTFTTIANLDSFLRTLRTATIQVIARAPLFRPSALSNEVAYEAQIIVIYEENEANGLTCKVWAKSYIYVENEANGLSCII